jgi:hypothetical protein
MNQELADVFQDRMDWYISTERYENAAKLRDMIGYYNGDEKSTQRYISYLIETFGPIYPHSPFPQQKEKPE